MHTYQFHADTNELKEMAADLYTTRDLMDKLSVRHKIVPSLVTVQKDAADEWGRCLDLVQKKHVKKLRAG